MSALIALLTDFGHADPFVGIMKGVILARAPEARIVDVSHETPPQDIRAAAFRLMEAVPYFPDGTLFVSVIDPGVGSARGILWARSDRHSFLAPDNGILGWAERAGPFREVRAVTNDDLFLKPVSATFHGRDVFAPVAAYLAAGGNASALGLAAVSWTRFEFPEPRVAKGRVLGTVLAIDRFGNAITNLRPAAVAGTFRHRRRVVGPLRSHYAAAAPGRALAVPGSSGFVELSVRDGSFAAKFKARVGDPVEALDAAA
ncbi:MAG: SAM-dependent chlorinase/fluorinase [Elusimicrobia bacterium]|nr:SAM-dependent chlorinase/fluorinase [Elusimicrobiota bacterium]